MDKAHPLSTPIVIRSLNIKKDPYRRIEGNKKVLVPEVPYLSVVRDLCTFYNALDRIFHFLWIYLLDITPHQLKGTRLVLNTSYDIYIEQLIWKYFILLIIEISILLDMQIRVISLILIRGFLVVMPSFLDVLLKRLWQLLPPIMLRF